MPIIPRTDPQVRQQSSSPVAIAGTGDARIAGNALQTAGEGLMQFGKDQLDFSRQMSRKDFENDTDNIIKLADDEAKKTAKADGSDYQQKFNDIAKPQLDDALNKHGGYDPRLRSELTSNLARVQADVNTTLMIRSGQMLEKNNYDRAESAMNIDANSIRENPNEALVDAKTRSYMSLVDTFPTSEENRIKMKKAYLETTAQSFIDGLGNKQQYGKALQALMANQEDANNFTSLTPQNAKELGFLTKDEAQKMQDEGGTYQMPTLTKGDKVTLTPAMAAVMASLDPKKKATLIDQMRSANNARMQMRIGDISAQKAGFIKSAEAGLPITEKDLAGVKNQINQIPNMTVAARVRAIDEVSSAFVLNQQIKLALTASPAEQADIRSKLQAKMAISSGVDAMRDPKLADSGKDFAVIANRQEMTEKYDRALASAHEKRKVDAAAAMLTDSQVAVAYAGTKDGQGFEQYAQMTLGKQNYVGVQPANQKLLPKEDAMQLANTITATTDPQQAQEVLSGLQAKYGKYLPQVLNEATALDKRVGDMRVLTLVNPTDRAGLFDAVKNSDAIDERIKNDPDVWGQRAKDADVLINSKMMGFGKALVGMSASSMGQASMNSFQTLMKAKVRRDMVQSDGKDVKQLVDEAYTSVIGNNFNVVDGGQSSVLIPKQVGSHYVNSDKQVGIFKSFMETYSQPENMKELGVFVPDVNKGQEDAYYNRLAKSARWVTNETQTGLMMVQPGPNGSIQPVKDKYNKRIEQSYDDIYMKPNPKVTENANKPATQKMFSMRNGFGGF